MSDRSRRLGVIRAALATLGAGALLIGGPAAATAGPPPPTSLTVCGTSLAADRSGAADQQPYRLTYRFSCDTDISAYTILFNRGTSGGNLDDFNPAPSVLGPDGVTPSATQSITCEGTTPSDGVNCNFGAGGVLSTGNNAVGTIDPTAPYCKSLPAHAKPGTRAIPQAIVQLIVTDNTGAQDGPFVLHLNRACPKVPDVAPKPKPKTKQKPLKGSR